jgi:DNA/RNA-binding domain of Phe-tRNA-synthetase-like protein
MFQITAAWKAAFPEAHAGVLVVRGAANPPQHAALDKRKSDLETELRARFAGFDRPSLLNLPALRVYDEYYRRFKKTYHIQLQLESIVFKCKPIPNVAALVEAMFMAEVEDLLLTAGHDLDVLQLPLTLDVAEGTEVYTLLRGDDQMLKPGDMFIRDGEGPISSVIYGPDRRTQIRPETRNAVFTAYAPAGIDDVSVKNHLKHILDNVRLFAPDAVLETMEVYGGR